MDDPVTVGSLVAGALSMTAEAHLKGVVGEAVRDGYNALKERVSHWASDELTALEITPSSKGRQVVVAEIIDAQSEDDRKSLRVLAETCRKTEGKRFSHGPQHRPFDSSRSSTRQHLNYK